MHRSLKLTLKYQEINSLLIKAYILEESIKVFSSWIWLANATFLQYSVDMQMFCVQHPDDLLHLPKFATQTSTL